MLVDTLKAALLKARKERDAAATAALSTLVGEIETLAKAGRGDLTDAVVVTVIKKFLKNLNETIALLPVDDAKEPFDSLLREKALYESFLPVQLTTDELSVLIDELIHNGAKDVGDVMKLLKTKHAGTYDGAAASALLKQRFSK